MNSYYFLLSFSIIAFSYTMVLSCKSVLLASIDFTPKWNLHPWEFDYIPDDLHESLSLNGIIHPPIVMAVAQNRFSIITGAKRLQFIKALNNPPELNCLVVERETPLTSILHLILADQSCSTPLSLPEKARFLQIASTELSQEEIFHTYQPKLQLPKGRAVSKCLQQLLAQEVEFIHEVHKGRIQDKMVTQLLSLPGDGDRLALVQLFKRFSMGDGKQKKFFSLFREVAYREDLSIAQYFLKEEIINILEHQEMNIPQKIQNLGTLLSRQCSPISSEAEDNFAQKVKDLQLAPNETITHSPSFEKDEVTLSITFENLGACRQYIENSKHDKHRNYL